MDRNRKANIFALVFMIVILIIGITIVANPEIRRTKKEREESIMTLDRVETSIYDKEGKEHRLDTTISIDFTDKDKKESSQTNKINRITRETISELEYDKVKSKNGLEYIKEELVDSYEENNILNKEDIEGIYVEEIVSDVYIESDEKEKDNPLERTLKGFKTSR